MADDSEVDVQAVQRDAVLLDVLAVRGDLEPFAGDPVVELLAPWVAGIDAGVDLATTAEVPVPPGGGRARGRAGLVAGVTTAVLMVSAGAAAAVTGDPLAVVRAPIQAFERVIPFDDDHDETTTSPEPAAPVAGPNTLLADAQRALARGDVDEAARLLADAKALLGDGLNPGQQQRIDRLQDRLDHPKHAGSKGNQAQGKESNQAQGKEGNQAQGKEGNQAQGKEGNQAQGKEGNQAQGKEGNQAQGSGGREQPAADAGDRSMPDASTSSSAAAHATSNAKPRSDSPGGVSGQGSSKK